MDGQIISTARLQVDRAVMCISALVYACVCLYDAVTLSCVAHAVPVERVTNIRRTPQIKMETAVSSYAAKCIVSCKIVSSLRTG